MIILPLCYPCNAVHVQGCKLAAKLTGTMILFQMLSVVPGGSCFYKDLIRIYHHSALQREKSEYPLFPGSGVIQEANDWCFKISSKLLGLKLV